jgi:hypothetical protein
MIAMKMTEVATCESAAAWRCLLCGEVTDAVIEANRKGPRQPINSRARLPVAGRI